MTEHLGGRPRPTTVRGSADAYLAVLPGSGGKDARAKLDLVVEALGPNRVLADVDADQVHAVLTELEQRQVWTADDWGTVDAWLGWARPLSNGSRPAPEEGNSSSRSDRSGPGPGGYREIRWGRSGGIRPGDQER